MKKLIVILLLSTVCFAGIEQDDFVLFRGDANASGDGENPVANDVSITDMIYLSNYLYSGGPAPVCPEAADFDGSGSLNLADIVAMCEWLFNGCSTCIAQPEEVGCEG